MKKKSLRPQIVAPVQRETTATGTKITEGGVVASYFPGFDPYGKPVPFAGDDAE